MISILVFDIYFNEQQKQLKTVDDDFLYDGIIYRLLCVSAELNGYEKNLLTLKHFYPKSQKVIEDYVFNNVDECKTTLQQIVNNSHILVHYSKDFLEKYLKRYEIKLNKKTQILDIYSKHAEKPGDLVSIASLMRYYFGEDYQKYMLQNNIYLRTFCVLRLFAKTYNYEIYNISEFYKQVFRQCEKYQQLKKFINNSEQLNMFYEQTRYNGMLALI